MYIIKDINNNFFIPHSSKEDVATAVCRHSSGTGWCCGHHLKHQTLHSDDAYIIEAGDILVFGKKLGRRFCQCGVRTGGTQVAKFCVCNTCIFQELRFLWLLAQEGFFLLNYLANFSIHITVYAFCPFIGPKMFGPNKNQGANLFIFVILHMIPASPSLTKRSVVAHLT